MYLFVLINYLWLKPGKFLRYILCFASGVSRRNAFGSAGQVGAKIYPGDNKCAGGRPSLQPGLFSSLPYVRHTTRILLPN